MVGDGIFDKLQNKEIINGIWNQTYEMKTNDIHESCSRQVEYVIAESIIKKTVDNITAVFIAFDSYQQVLQQKSRVNINFSQINNQFKKERNENINLKNSLEIKSKKFSKQNSQQLEQQNQNKPKQMNNHQFMSPQNTNQYQNININNNINININTKNKYLNIMNNNFMKAND